MGTEFRFLQVHVFLVHRVPTSLPGEGGGDRVYTLSDRTPISTPPPGCTTTTLTDGFRVGEPPESSPAADARSVEDVLRIGAAVEAVVAAACRRS